MSESIHLICAACGAINRIPVERLAAQPQCGRCHKSLFSGATLTLGERSFQRYLDKDDLPLLVELLGTMVWAVQSDGAGICRSGRGTGAAIAAGQS